MPGTTAEGGPPIDQPQETEPPDVDALLGAVDGVLIDLIGTLGVDLSVEEWRDLFDRARAVHNAVVRLREARSGRGVR